MVKATGHRSFLAFLGYKAQKFCGNKGTSLTKEHHHKNITSPESKKIKKHFDNLLNYYKKQGIILNDVNYVNINYSWVKSKKNALNAYSLSTNILFCFVQAYVLGLSEIQKWIRPQELIIINNAETSLKHHKRGKENPFAGRWSFSIDQECLSRFWSKRRMWPRGGREAVSEGWNQVSRGRDAGSSSGKEINLVEKKYGVTWKD